MPESHLEKLAMLLIKESGLPEPIKEFRFHETRRWRCDFVWLFPHYTHGVPGPYQIIGVILEIEGAVWIKSRHTSGKGFTADCEKYNEAALNRFLVLRVTHEHLVSGKAIEWLKRALGIG